jgi:hypothetical protein
MNSKFVNIGLTVLLLLGFIAVSGVSATEDDDFSVQTLRGLKGVYVLIENLPPELSNAGLSREQILQETEQRLRGSGIGIMTLKESFQERGRPYMEIDVKGWKNSSGTCVYFLEVSLNQEVRLMRTSGTLHSQTWRVRETGALENDDLPSLVGRIGGLVDRFAEAYDSANKGRRNVIRH